ncbi:MAG TPA: hypothetical protein VK666_09685 [Chryseolinea sp.]|nr:hypothetical protein [Chryseolinea sp.]
MKFVFVSFLLSVAFSGRGQERFVTVASGGGFSGAAVVYKIGDDGTVLKGQGIGDNTTFNESAKLKKCATKKYFRKTRSLLSEQQEFNHPGNIYSSITLYENGKEKKMTWGDSAHSTPEKAKKLYGKINASLARLTFSQNQRK